MSVSHEPWLVALSLVVAFQGSFVGLSLSVQLGDAADLRRRSLLAGSALTLALAIWSMHFVGMLAARLPVTVDFLVLPTLLSFLVCVLVVGIAVFAASSGELTAVRLGLSSLVMGAGICIMHYLGMYAVHTSAAMTHDPVYVVASFLVAFNAAGLALWLCFGSGRQPPMVVSSIVLGLAIAAMHYIAMAGMTLTPRDVVGPPDAPAVSPGTLAIVVACVTFLVSGLFLLTLVPVRRAGNDVRPAAAVPHPVAPEAANSAQVASSGVPEAGGTVLGAQEQEGLVADRGSHQEATLESGPKGLDVRTASSSETDQRPAARPPAGLQAAPTNRGTAGLNFKRTLPVECDGVKCQISTGEVVSVQADAHYSRLFDGQRTLFCPLAISEVERALDPKMFSRVHRSHIVNLGKVSSYKRSGDSGVLLMAGGAHHQVPVSRSRWSRIKARLDADGTDGAPAQIGQVLAAQ
ncbi:MHYT domain-containing protein [Roseibium sp.]|uniref:MHYT domain-containing protein n=1 Tax=Roseibium sp. TaxID=1936156 RepID=UPI003A972E84